MQGWYYVKSLTGQRHDRVQTESQQLQPGTAVSTLIFWIFPIVPCHAFCMWHWPVGKDLDLSFIWGHHHLSECMNISRPAEYFIACYTVLMRPNRVETTVYGCKCWLQFELYHVIAPLSFYAVSALHHSLLTQSLLYVFCSLTLVTKLVTKMASARFPWTFEFVYANS